MNCYFCGALVDERECMPADNYNDCDGGDMCLACYAQREDRLKYLVLLRKMSYLLEECLISGVNKGWLADEIQIAQYNYKRLLAEEIRRNYGNNETSS